MPSAQGHITVRRRAKDGTNGSDAVRYWVIPSATQIKRAQDGTMYPATVTCEKCKQTGNSEPIATSEGYLYYKIGYTDGSVTAKLTYGSTGVKATSGMAWIKFMLEVSQIEVASETVSVVADGRSVSSVKEWYLRWAQSSGVTTDTGGWSETVPQLTQTYKYLWNYEEISFDDGTTMKTAPAIIGVYGRGIKSVTNYYLATSSSSDVTTTTAGWTTTVQAPTPEKRYLWNYEVVTYDDDSTTTTSPHIICVYGEKGDPGEDAYLLDLDNEMQGIPCNSSGSPTGNGTLASTNSTVYKGSKIDSGWTFSKEDTGCTSSIDASGTVSVTAMSADTASVKVKATKNSITLSAVMSLYKVKPGSDGKNGTNGTNGNDGVSPVVYSIEASASAISRNAAGTLSPTTITAYKNKTVGSSTTRTSEKTLKYKRAGQDSTETTLSGEGGEIKNINASCTAIELKIYDTNGTTILDSERIPIVKDGAKGDPGDPGDPGQDAVHYWLVPSVGSVKKSSAGILSVDSVSCNVMKQVGAGNASATTDLFVIYKKVETNVSNPPFQLYTPGDSIAITATTSHIEFQLYLIGSVTMGIASGTGAMLDSVTIPVVADGGQGVPGPTYKPLRVREWSKISNHTKLTTGLKDTDDWTDIVYILTDVEASGVRYWKCIKDFTKTSGQQPPTDSDTPSTNSLVSYLQKTTNFGSLATDIFLANYALIRNLGVEAIDMRDSSGNILFQAKGGNVVCNTGDFKNIHISGNSTFRGFMFREKFIVTSSNYSQITKQVLVGSWEDEDQYYTLLDLEKTGNWIEVKSLPTNYSQAYFAWLPSIRVGLAYTDAYRDYVRQFMGNEIVIYNSCAKTLGIDTGENSVSIKRDMACRFKMVFAAEKMGNSDIFLERIKWEWCEPFQF